MYAKIHGHLDTVISGDSPEHIWGEAFSHMHILRERGTLVVYRNTHTVSLSHIHKHTDKQYINSTDMYLNLTYSEYF